MSREIYSYNRYFVNNNKYNNFLEYILITGVDCEYLFLFTDAKPTESEKAIYEEVLGVLKIAPQLMEDMKGYGGASVEIREVRLFVCLSVCLLFVCLFVCCLLGYTESRR